MKVHGSLWNKTLMFPVLLYLYRTLYLFVKMALTGLLPFMRERSAGRTELEEPGASLGKIWACRPVCVSVPCLCWGNCSLPLHSGQRDRLGAASPTNPVQRIKDRRKPLQASTLRRIAQGLRRYQEAQRKVQEKAHVSAWTAQVPLLMTLRHGELPSPPAWLMSYYRTGTLAPVTEPVGTITTVERYALLTAQALHTLPIEECGLRMLEPHELQAMMAFPASYRLTGNRHERVRQLGNAVTPPVMRMLMERCLAALA